jgi:Zn-dependent membrane protease YugP
MVALALIGAIIFIALIFGPRAWIGWTMKKHGAERPDFPGTGGELARHLLDQAGLQDVRLETTGPLQDHYSSEERTVRLSEENFRGRSVTAVAVAAHEVGHAIQHRDEYAPLMLRQRLMRTCISIERAGGLLLMATPFVFALTRSPGILVAEVVAALGILASTIVIHTFTLPTEFDASFKRALPELEKHLPPEDIEGARSVLKAAAFTYVAGALVSLLNVARWLRVLRF